MSENSLKAELVENGDNYGSITDGGELSPGLDKTHGKHLS